VQPKVAAVKLPEARLLVLLELLSQHLLLLRGLGIDGDLDLFELILLSSELPSVLIHQICLFGLLLFQYLYHLSMAQHSFLPRRALWGSERLGGSSTLWLCVRNERDCSRPLTGGP